MLHIHINIYIIYVKTSNCWGEELVREIISLGEENQVTPSLDPLPPPQTAPGPFPLLLPNGSGEPTTFPPTG